MNRSIRKGILLATAAVPVAGVAIFAAAAAITISGPAFAAAHEYRFELVQVAPAGPGRSDVIVRLVRTADGRPIVNANISASATVGAPVPQPGYRQFRVETVTTDPQTLQVSAKIPGATRIERTFNSSVKFWQERKVRSEGKVVTGVVTFNAQ